MEEEWKLSRFLFAGCFDECSGGVLLIMDFDTKMLSLPGGIVLPEYIAKAKDETWRRDFIAQRLKDQVGITHFIKNGKRVLIATGVQPIPATYNVNTKGCTKEYSAIIVGDVQYRYLSTPFAAFYDFDNFIDFHQDRVTPEQEILILRIIASRDYPDRNESKRAGKKLSKKHK
jgi:hypothetical protein